MGITITVHASARMQQRVIPFEVLDWLLEFGSSMRCSGADRIYFDRKARRRVAETLDATKMRRVEKFWNVYAVVADSGCVITAARRTRRLWRA